MLRWSSWLNFRIDIWIALHPKTSFRKKTLGVLNKCGNCCWERHVKTSRDSIQWKQGH